MEQRYRVLAIDDDEPTLNIINEVLKANFDILTVKKSSLARTAFDYYQPDLVIVDIMMPEVGGFEVIKYIKDEKHASHVFVMILSCKNDPEDMKLGFAKGADFYITKPFQPERLFKNVDIAFRNKPPLRKSKKHSLAESRTYLVSIEKRQQEFLAEQEKKKHEEQIAEQEAQQEKLEQEKLHLEQQRQQAEAQAKVEQDRHTAMHNIVEEEYEFIENEAEDHGHPEDKVVGPANEIPSVRTLKDELDMRRRIKKLSKDKNDEEEEEKDPTNWAN